MLISISVAAFFTLFLCLVISLFGIFRSRNWWAVKTDNPVYRLIRERTIWFLAFSIISILAMILIIFTFVLDLEANPDESFCTFSFVCFRCHQSCFPLLLTPRRSNYLLQLGHLPRLSLRRSWLLQTKPAMVWRLRSISRYPRWKNFK